MDAKYLKLALEEALKRKGFTAPNPAVGAVVVRNGEFVAAGTHWERGKPHAEVDALLKAGARAQGATLYVTLEPCNHQGLTPPCTERVLESGIQRVVYAFSDPNPHVKGGGTLRLRENGVVVERLALPEIDAFYQSYARWVTTGRPTVHLKLAMTLDGKIAGPDGRREKISGPAFDEFSHLNRRRSDAILTTAQTILNDNPRFDVRAPVEPCRKRVYVLDSELRLLPRPDLNVFSHAKELVIFHRGPEERSRDRARLVAVPRCDDAMDLVTTLKTIGQEGVHDLWVECGARLTQRLWSLDLVDEMIIAVAPKFLGPDALAAPGDLSFTGREVQWRILGDDAICTVRRHVHRNC
ncbi:MAG: bifunctional diaminohydroxyphosphoribosylaminopyrimidine deaminase/5-amino-6-(5-phosphoribosylamino)uracil reductase RibD [Deltaproteobacteria bacterium]|nr:bifunctional diaminohydroxyphosphoribosylaminopyrimidine deaminase/5-amino-6-(5-phosphoribosylamino)uracil reductase RibD [Deltaproteobacteria bacterium]MBI3294455.1 bifunctional diaminohydroxyphosphoribosylaminopyrimidine deaminase/5-amino-6-(5-phosphoribosylamino)uracil reductase RibD [Deltaproteobacteria bacterium]